MWPESKECGRIHEGEFLVGSNVVFGCGKMDHEIRDYLQLLGIREIIINGPNPTLPLVQVVVRKKIDFMLFILKKIMRVPQI